MTQQTVSTTFQCLAVISRAPRERLFGIRYQQPSSAVAKDFSYSRLVAVSSMYTVENSCNTCFHLKLPIGQDQHRANAGTALSGRGSQQQSLTARMVNSCKPQVHRRTAADGVLFSCHTSAHPTQQSHCSLAGGAWFGAVALNHAIQLLTAVLPAVDTDHCSAEQNILVDTFQLWRANQTERAACTC